MHFYIEVGTSHKMCEHKKNAEDISIVIWLGCGFLDEHFNFINGKLGRKSFAISLQRT